LGLITLPILNLSDFLEGAARVGHSDIVEHLLAFAQRNNIAYNKLIHRHSAVAAIDGPNSLEVFRVFVKAWPESAKLEMGLLNDPLSYSIAHRKAELVKFLLDNGADPNLRCTSYRGPGYYLRESVITSTNLVDTEALLQHGAQIKHSGAIREAAKSGRVKALELLLKYGGDIDERLPKDVGFLERKKRDQHASETPLHVAVLNNQVDVTRWLLNHGADTEVLDLQGRTAELIALESGKKDIIGLFGYRGS
jgi:ankyrin repeat protein